MVWQVILVKKNSSVSHMSCFFLEAVTNNIILCNKNSKDSANIRTIKEKIVI